LRDLSVDERVILKWVLKELESKGVDWIQRLTMWPEAGSCEQINETSGSVKGGEFLDQPSAALLKTGCAA
jgi:hypothetical protein